jgi:acyl carrier protein
MDTSTSTGIAAVRNWLLSRAPGLDSIDPDEDLVSGRLVDSLSFVEFLFTVEEASGVEIDRDSVDLADFRTLGAIERKFFS